MEKLARSASGLRHLRWAREIYATLAAHVDATDLGAARKGALEKELVRLDARIQALSGAVKAYRDFLERERVRYRGAIRAAMFSATVVAEAVLEDHPSVGFARSITRDGAKGTVEAAELEVARLRAMAADLHDERDTKARKRSPELAQAATRLEGAVDLLYSEAVPRQRGLKASLEMAVAELRAHLEEMDARVAAVVSEAFLDSLYPALAAQRTRVADEGDEDDDATARLVED